MNVREYALDAIYRVLNDHGYANLIMRNENELSEADQALASELVYGTIRNVSFLEFQWKDLVQHIEPRTAALLDLSVYQLQYLDRIPPYAVINEAVNLANRNQKNFVNAVLHKVLKRGMVHPHERDALANRAIELSHPLWLMKLWAAHYGIDTAIRIAEHDQKRPVVYGRINTLKCTKEELAKVPGISFVSDYSFLYDAPIARTDFFKSGKVVVQDKASALIPTLLEVAPGMKVLDVCAAPGTKTQEMAMLMKNEGEIIATDLYPDRIHLLNELMRKTGVSIVHAEAADATKANENWQKESFDRILVDAPCSGLGDLSHKPEIRFHVTPEDLDVLASTQQQILNANAGYLKSKGILVYSTCTLNKKENEQQTKKFLQAHPEFTLISEQTIFPYEENTDGFYAAQFRRA